ncbi:MAG: hypothetical protein HKN49_11360 [Gammaproteobacteria bacterium]|nr:hypothetical protein [Gammaproteobacteria bacterium]
MATVSLMSLWLPIVAAAAIVFVASALVWMVLKWHDSDWSKLPDEEAARAALTGAAEGEYSVPYAANNAERASEAFQARCKEGPVVMLTVFPRGLPNMGKQLGLWFVYCLLVSWFVAYLLTATLAAGTNYLQVFQVAGTAAFLAYAGGAVPAMIWFGQGKGRTVKDIADGLVYALLTAGVFGWLWP